MSSSNIRIQVDDAELAQQLMEDLEQIDAPRGGGSSTTGFGGNPELYATASGTRLPKIADTKIVIESAPPNSKMQGKTGSYKLPSAAGKGATNLKAPRFVDAISQATEMPDLKHKKRSLFRKHKANRLEFSTIRRLAEQVKRPVQLIAEILKGQIALYERHHQLHERGDSKKQILNRE